MTTEHTPGPWHTNADKNAIIAGTVGDPGWQLIASLQDNKAGNINLLLAAPLLLAALKDALPILDSVYLADLLLASFERTRLARAAINAAKGAL